MCFNTEMYKKLSCSPCLFGPCDEALLEVKSFSLSTQCKRNRLDCPRKSHQNLYWILSLVSQVFRATGAYAHLAFCAPKSNPYIVVKSLTIWPILQRTLSSWTTSGAPRESLAVFPVSELKSEQILESIVGRRDVLGQLPTGFGKNLFFSTAAMKKAYHFFLESFTPQLQLGFHAVSIL